MERLKGTAAIICEFNPFHFGHKHLLDVAHSEYPVVFGIMSGNLIQRGGNACADKYLRASAAVECGFDGVLELPFPFSSLSARDFARAGVHIAEEAGFEALVFGAEDPQAVNAATEIVRCASFEQEVSELVKEKKNLSYPKATEQILAKSLGEETAKLLSKPNNILALEYIKAASKRDILKIRVVPRSPDFASAGSLRRSGVPADGIPEKASPFFKNTVADNSLFPYLSVAAKLYTGDKAMLYGIDESLAGRLTKALREKSGTEEIISACRSAGDTDSRIRRGLTSILFGITKYQAAEMPNHTTLLAAGEKGLPVIKQIRKQSSLSLVVKPASLTGNKQYENSVRAERVLREIFSVPDPLCRTPYIKGAK